MNIQVSLPVRLSIALALVGLLPLAYAIWSLFDVNRAGMREQVLRTHTVAASTAAERIAAFLATRRALADSIASNEELVRDPKSDVARDFLQGLLVADPTIERIELRDASGASVIRVQRRGSEARTGALPLTPTFWTQGGAPWLLNEEPVTGGTLLLVSDATDIETALASPEIGEHAQLILAAPGQLLSGAVPLSDFPAPMITAARASKVNGSGVYELPDHSRILGAFAPVDGTNWFVLSRQPATVAEAIARKMRVRAAVAAGAALVLAAILGAFAHFTVVRPIREVVRAQQKLVGGEAAPARGGEIHELRRNFELIERRIVDQEDLSRFFLGRYQVLSVVGHGGMGTVFRGWDPKLQRHVALKTVRFGGDSHDEAKELIDTLVREAILGARIAHPNVVAVYDVEDSPDAAFIAMELVEGVSLETYATPRRKIAPGAAAVLGLAIARALEAAHERGTLHQDIKPANVLLGRDGAIKVTDFGISALLTSVSSAEGFVYGTPGFIAPEAARGKGADARSDLFALGAVLYTVVTGRNPFIRGGVAETLVSTVAFDPPPLAEVIKDGEVVRAVSEVVAALMEKDPDKRIQTAADASARFRSIVTAHGLVWQFEPGETAAATQARIHAALIPTIAMEQVR